MLTLHGFAYSNYHNIVKHALMHKGIRFEEHIVYPGTPELLAVNPAGKVPAMTTEDGLSLAESSVLVDYLEDAYPATPLYDDMERDGPVLGQAQEPVQLRQRIRIVGLGGRAELIKGGYVTENHAAIDFHVEREVLQHTGIAVSLKSIDDLFGDFTVTTPGLHWPERSDRSNRPSEIRSSHGMPPYTVLNRSGGQIRSHESPAAPYACVGVAPRFRCFCKHPEHD